MQTSKNRPNQKNVREKCRKPVPSLGPGLWGRDLQGDKVPVLHGALAHLLPALLLKVLGHEAIVKLTKGSRMQTIVDGRIGTLALPSALRSDARSLILIPRLFLNQRTPLDASRGCGERSRHWLESSLQLDGSVPLSGAHGDKVVDLMVSIRGSTLNVLADGLAWSLCPNSAARGFNAADPLHIRGIGSHPRGLVSRLPVRGILVDGGDPHPEFLRDRVGQTTGLEGSKRRIPSVHR